MKTGEILAQHTFLKVAISDELKTRVAWERLARKRLTDYSPKSMKKMNLTNPQYNIAETPINYPPKYQPIHNDSLEIVPPFKVRSEDIKRSGSTAPSLGMSLSDHVAGVKAQKIMNKAKNLKTLGKGALIGAGVLGGGMLANHLLNSKPKPLTKTAFSPSMVSGLELGGLGVLAAPSVAGLTGHPMGEKAKEVAEVGGLGVLAAHPAYELGHAAVNAVKGLPAQSTGLLQRAGQSIGQGINKLRPMIPAMPKLAFTSFYQEILKK